MVTQKRAIFSLLYSRNKETIPLTKHKKLPSPKKLA
jgi:hypothetical protein